MIEQNAPTQRLVSVDTFRGFVMALMMSEVLNIPLLAEAHPGNRWLALLAFHQDHVAWAGCSLHDLIQPGFSFLVGVSLVYSLASRSARGDGAGGLWVHTLKRSAILVLLGVFLRSLNREATYWTFEDTLSQIGLGYPFLVAVALTKPKTRLTVLIGLLGAYWSLWAFFPVPPGSLSEGMFSGGTAVSAHWNPSCNAGLAFDRFFLNLFPRAQPFVANEGSYLTLSFIPTLGTMMLGLFAGEMLRGETSQTNKMLSQLRLGGALVVGGVLLDFLGLCPIVKRLWTPSWTLFSGGLCFLLLAAAYWLFDVKRFRRVASPFVVLGANSIVAYCMAHLCETFFRSSFHTHLPAGFFETLGGSYAPVLEGAFVLFFYWYILNWFYQKRIFVKI